MTDFGAVTINGITYKMTDQAELTNRVFPNWFGDVEEGDGYVSEWEAPALDPDGNEVRVRWQFDEVKGAETEPDMLNWDDPHKVINN